ncbi:MAG: three-helix bundle dimerization domain-containing protein [Mycobacterium sp.]
MAFPAGLRNRHQRVANGCIGYLRKSLATCDMSKIRDCVPLLVERRVRAELAGLTRT